MEQTIASLLNEFQSIYMHIIITNYINSNQPLTSIVEKHYDKNEYLETVFLKLVKSYNVKAEQQLFLELDQAIVNGHPDTNVYLLFISVATTFASIHLEFERANIIHSIGLSISKEKIHPTIQSYNLLSTATLKFFEGKLNEFNLFFKESISLVKRNNPRYFVIILHFASLISLHGRLKELDKEDLALLDAPPIDEAYALASLELKFSHCIFTANYKDGINLLEAYKVKCKNPYLINGKTNLLKIISGNFDENSYQDEFYKLFANACYYLSLENYKEAIKYSNLIQRGNYANAFSMKFEKYIPLHIELCLKNKGMARLLLQEIQLKNGQHYLDDFFLARLQLLELNTEGANESFSQLIENVKRYDAMNRLTFELQFAKELKTSDILFLMNGMNVSRAGKTKEIKKEIAHIPLKSAKGIKLLVGDSPSITQIKNLVKKFATLKEPVLITGETGTGKELVSRAIHDEGPNPHEPFLAINCGALTESLLQSELFGYVAGAFTGAQKERKGIFEAAGKGTVFLDEFGDISPKMQVSLLRVLESNEIRLIGGTSTRTIECKIVIATNIDLQQAVKEKKFREDLYFRLTRFDLNLPPLRERTEDISKLIEHFLETRLEPNGKKVQISRNLLNALSAYRWPGNIRELKNEMERLKILHSDKEILDIDDFDFDHLQEQISLNPKPENSFVDKKITNPKITKPEQILEDRVLKIVQRGSKIDQRHELIKALFRQYKKLSRMQIIEIMSISPVTATKDLEVLCKARFIERRTPTKSVKSHYFVLLE